MLLLREPPVWNHPFARLACAVLSLHLPALAADTLPVEDAAARAALPLWQVISAATASELTPAAPESLSFRTWTVSHGDAGSRRYSALDQINRANVKQLRVAWTYHSADGSVGKE